MPDQITTEEGQLFPANYQGSLDFVSLLLSMVAKGLWRAGWEGWWAQKKKEPSLPATPTPLVQLPRWRCYSGQRAPGKWGCCLLEVKPCLTEHSSVSGQLFTGLPPPCPTPTQALGRGTALTDSNSPGAGASEIGIEDGLRRERMRVYINLCWVGSQPQEPTGEKGTSPQPGGSEPALFLPFLPGLIP